MCKEYGGYNWNGGETLKSAALLIFLTFFHGRFEVACTVVAEPFVAHLPTNYVEKCIKGTHDDTIQ